MPSASNSLESSQDFVDNVRRRFLADYQLNKDAYDQVDVEKVCQDDWTIERFIIDPNGDEDDVCQRLIRTMRWRKSFGVNQLQSTDFPQEYWKIGEIHSYVPDEKGIVPVYIRVKLHKQLSDWSPISKRFVVHILESLDKHRNWGVIWDCAGGSIFNVDIDLLTFVVTTCFKHYPSSQKYFILHELPFVLWGAYQLARSFIPEKYRNLITFTTQATLPDVIGGDNLPDYLGGTCTKKYRRLVEDAPSIVEVALKNGINEKAIKSFISHYKKYINQDEASYEDVPEKEP